MKKLEEYIEIVENSLYSFLPEGNLKQNNESNCNHHNSEHDCEGHDNCSCEK